MDRPAWAFSDTAIIFKYYEDDSKRVFVLEGLDHHFDILQLFTTKDYCLITIPCHTTDWNFQFGRRCLEYQNPRVPLSNFIFLANTKEQELQALSNGFNSIYFNHNALLDERIYWLEQDSYREYKLILNTRPERNFKRPYLAKNIDKLAVIQGYNFRTHDYMDLNELNPTYLNNQRLSIDEVVSIYNRSSVGGIFSEKEGACYSSSEYMLCGLPVISTYSEGGRDVWYNNLNSIICQPTEESVAEALAEAEHKLEAGIFNRERIRAMHIHMQYEMRDTFCNLLCNLCKLTQTKSWRLFSQHLLTTNKLQHKVHLKDVECYINNPIMLANHVPQTEQR